MNGKVIPMTSIHKPDNKVGLQRSWILQRNNIRHLQTDDRRRNLLSNLKTETNLNVDKEQVERSNALSVEPSWS